MFNALNFMVIFSDPMNSTILNAKVSGFMCPDDPINTLEASGADKLHGEHGEWCRLAECFRPERRYAGPERCLLRQMATTFAGISDGLSNTAFFSEREVADGNNAIVSPKTDVFFSPLAPTTADQAAQMCQAVNIYDLANQFPLFMGAPWVNGQHVFQTITGPNTRSCGFFTILRATMPPSSRHPGGVNVLFGDGAVRFVKDSVDIQAWRATGTRAGGEVVSADAL